MKKPCLWLACFVVVVVSAGCSTIRGVGEDVKTIGGWMVKGSDNVQSGIEK